MELEKITGETCTRKILAMRNLSLNEEDERCRSCTENMKYCKDYKPVRISQIPIRQGRYYAVTE